MPAGERRKCVWEGGRGRERDRDLVEVAGEGELVRASGREGMAEGQVVLAWVIVWLVLVWCYLWKCIAFWMAARRGQLGWYVVIAVCPPMFGAVEMVYVFLVAPRREEVGAGVGRASGDE